MHEAALILIATYNERQNLEPLVNRILALSAKVDVLVVDDNSPDGTGDLADRLAATNPAVKVMHRARKEGLSAALIAGFSWALERDYDFIINIDGDLSHNPDVIPELLASAVGADLVLGSRYVNGIRVVNWQPNRLFLSLVAARYVRSVTGMPFRDPTSGFRCFRRRALESASLATVSSRGYSFHIETLHRVWRKGFTVAELPIFYTDRVQGITKLNRRIIVEALWITLRLLFENRLRRSPMTLLQGDALPVRADGSAEKTVGH